MCNVRRGSRCSTTDASSVGQRWRARKHSVRQCQAGAPAWPHKRCQQLLTLASMQRRSSWTTDFPRRPARSWHGLRSVRHHAPHMWLKLQTRLLLTRVSPVLRCSAVDDHERELRRARARRRCCLRAWHAHSSDACRRAGGHSSDARAFPGALARRRRCRGSGAASAGLSSR